ncbi:hypothetical protein JOF41_005182 [Saccharothrix coeruleofusca]|uniref:hypothetical protein n=1 Tax=Saccharothrix coeruleofusca TaxID=33919 RepID=UPI001AE8017A|nr:hypothetical protein [Saccharothrix coeruleofusca]MBP2339004.1 hypothetical protein [Saccharothrix coeruleofusca]
MLISVDALVSNVVKITPQLAGAIRNFRAEVTYCKGAMDALTIGHTHLRKTGYRHHSLHPAYTTEDAVTHPDHLAAAAAVLHDRVRAVRSRKPAEECASLEVATGDSVLLVGGPAWEGVTRAVFGYEQAGRGLACKGLGVELPYRWHVDAEAIHAKAVRFVKTPKGFRTEEEPNWGIVGPRGRRYFPTVGHDGFLVTDYLLLTKLPNFLGEESYGSEQVIVNFGGAHGIGQRAAELLLSRRDVVRKVAEVLDIDVHRAATWPAAYQALFRVGDISHGVVRGSRARDIVLVDAVRITESPEWWHTWANGVHASLRRWS